MKLRASREASFARSSALINTAPARVVSTCDRYFGLARNASWSGPAWSSGARLPTRCEPSPTTSPPNRWTMSSSVNAMPILSPVSIGVGALALTPIPCKMLAAVRSNLSVPRSVPLAGVHAGGPLTGGRARPRSVARCRQCLQHLIGDVDTRAHVHRFLNDQVVMLLFGDLLDHLVRPVEHRGQLFVAALVQVLAKLALLALKVRVHLRQIALLLRAISRRHRRAVLVERIGHRFQLLRHVGEILVTLGELGLELDLRGLGG